MISGGYRCPLYDDDAVVTTTDVGSDQATHQLDSAPRRPDHESLARKGEAMTTAVVVMYAYDQIDQARTELKAVSE